MPDYSSIGKKQWEMGKNREPGVVSLKPGLSCYREL
jgi:hypothetical protein